MPKQTRQMVDRCLVVAAARTTRKIITARGPPAVRGKLVTMMTMGPRWAGVCSFAASEAEVDDAGYSPGGLSELWSQQGVMVGLGIPPAPNPTIPRAIWYRVSVGRWES